MYIEDRLFSENTEEVLYSVLMDEEEYALFSEFQREFSLGDKMARGEYKHPYLYNGPYPYGKDALKSHIEKAKGEAGEDTEKYNRKVAKAIAAAASIPGATLGYLVARDEFKKSKLVSSGAGVAAGLGMAALMGGAEYAGRKMADKIHNKAYKNKPKYRKNLERFLDNGRVVNGEMSEEDFDKKWKNKQK